MTDEQLDLIAPLAHKTHELFNKNNIEEMSNAAFELYNVLPKKPNFPAFDKKVGLTEAGDIGTIDASYFRNKLRVEFLASWANNLPLFDLLETELMRLPTQCPQEIDFGSYIDDLFEKYLDQLKKLVNTGLYLPHFHSVTDALCKAITAAISNYSDGFPELAYNSLAKGMTHITTEQHGGESSVLSAFRGTFGEEQKLFYRMRTGSNRTYSHHEMFHIPFQLGRLVGSQRYSIPGFPCLYLGNSAYTCWEELKKPDLNTVQTSLFEKSPDAELKYLNIGFTPRSINILIKKAMLLKVNEQRTYSRGLAAYMIIWPLIAACSMRVANKEDAFKPEYIIPQLLLQWVRDPKNGYDGICYFSVEVDSSVNTYLELYQNYVFPVQKRNKSGQGHCEKLKEKFLVTDAVPWQVFKVVHPSEGPFALATHNMDFEFVKGSTIKYSQTDFAKLESFLYGRDTYKIT